MNDLMVFCKNNDLIVQINVCADNSLCFSFIDTESKEEVFNIHTPHFSRGVIDPYTDSDIIYHVLKRGLKTLSERKSYE